MPGPVSDSYDPEFGTGENADSIRRAVEAMHITLGVVIKSPPKFILDVVNGEDGPLLQATFTKRQWRLIRFACERAMETL